jgi:hypothetical protein
MMAMIRRRTFLLMGTAAVALVGVAGSGAAFVMSDGYGAWIRDTLQRALPGYDLEPAGLARFIDEYNHRKNHGNKKLRVFAAAERLVEARWALPKGMAANVEEEERHIVSDFLLGSEFFKNYPDGAKTVTYAGLPEACISPFARF